MRRAILSIIVLLVTTFLLGQNEENANVITKGYGLDAQSAQKDALRNAVEKVVGTLIDSDTKVENAQVIDDIILSYSRGYVKSFNIISRSVDDGLFVIEIEVAVVKTKLIDKLIDMKIFEKKLSGESMFGEAFSKLQKQKDEVALVELVWKNFPGNAYIINFSKPQIVPKENDKIRAIFEVEFKWDPNFLSSLKRELENVAIQKTSSELFGYIKSGMTYAHPYVYFTKSFLWNKYTDVKGRRFYASTQGYEVSETVLKVLEIPQVPRGYYSYKYRLIFELKDIDNNIISLKEKILRSSGHDGPLGRFRDENWGFFFLEDFTNIISVDFLLNLEEIQNINKITCRIEDVRNTNM